MKTNESKILSKNKLDENSSWQSFSRILSLPKNKTGLSQMDCGASPGSPGGRTHRKR